MFRRLLHGLRVSPYPLLYTLKYPYFARNPSFKQHTKIPLAPLQEGSPSKTDVKLLFFGDILPVPKIPIVSEPIRALVQSSDIIISNLESCLMEESQ